MTERRIIHLVDDEESIRRSAGFMLRTSGFTVETYESGDAFLKVAKDAEPGCILLDIRMPGMDGLEVQQALAERGVTMPVVMLTGHGNVDLCRRAFKGGAMEFLQKPVDDDVFLDAVQAAVRLHIASRERQAVTLAASERLARLSGREHDVLVRIVTGMSNKEIARELELSPRTVETYRANVFDKLEADSLAQLIRQYAGLLDEPSP